MITAVILVAAAILLTTVVSLLSRVRALENKPKRARLTLVPAGFELLRTDTIVGTTNGPVMLRIVKDGHVNIGYIILPKGVVVDERFNRQLSDASRSNGTTGHTLGNKSLDGLVNSHNILPNGDYKRALSAVVRVLDDNWVKTVV